MTDEELEELAKTVAEMLEKVTTTDYARVTGGALTAVRDAEREQTAREAIRKLRIYSCGCARRLAEHFGVEVEP